MNVLADLLAVLVHLVAILGLAAASIGIVVVVVLGLRGVIRGWRR